MDSTKPAFRAFDPTADIDVRQRYLPHWFQPEVAIFVTFRTLDSLPKEVLLRIQRELEEWLRAKGLPLTLASPYSYQSADTTNLHNKLSAFDKKHFRKLKDRLFHRALDECHGECLLRNQKLAAIVAKAISYYHNKAYDLDSFVIMPNHVHAILQFRAEFDLTIIGQSWMRYTARAINKQQNIHGAFWAPEPFDHLIRSDEQFRYLQNYIASNPEKAKLLPGQYLYWSSV